MTDFAELRILREASDAIHDAGLAMAAREPRHDTALAAINQARALLDSAQRVIEWDMKRP